MRPVSIDLGGTLSTNVGSTDQNKIVIPVSRYVGGIELTLADLTSREAVIEAVREYDELGRDAFLKKYGFGPSKRYYIEVNGQRYESKAIAGVAFGKQHPEQGFLSHNDFSGGISTVGRKMAELGFLFIDTEMEKHDGASIGYLLKTAMDEFAIERGTPFETKSKLWAAMNAVKERFESFEAVQSRPNITCQWSLGAGNWLKIPWIALFDDRVTKSAQSGIYFVLLVSEDLSRVYLTLNQGATKVKNTYGLAGARTFLAQTATRCREILEDVDTSLLSHESDVDLHTEHKNSKLYEVGAIVHAVHEPIEGMSDKDVEQQLEQLLSAYETLRVSDFGVSGEVELTRAAIEAAMDNCDQIGVTSFLDQHGFGRPQVYWTRREPGGKLYPATATVAVAHKYAAGSRPLSAKEFHIGFDVQAANATLERFGFEVVQVQDDASEAQQEFAPHPTNLILYGPPGTGKTYATAEEAVRLCDGSVPSDRAILMGRYAQLVDEGRIGFVTFHQSYSYEEFVEGLRPVTSDGGEGSGAGFRLEPQDGAFKAMADLARKGTLPKDDQVSFEGRTIFKLSMGESGKSQYDWVFEEGIANDDLVFGFGNIDWSDESFADKTKILAAFQEAYPAEELSLNSNWIQSVDKFRNDLKVGDVVLISKGLHLLRAIGFVKGEYRYVPRQDGEYCHRRSVDWLWIDEQGVPIQPYFAGSLKQFSMKTIYPCGTGDLHIGGLERLVNSAVEVDEPGRIFAPHVLVVDEINRANISKVFGELITLIETDKRLGQPNALTVTLPYSKTEFGVPSNLHIVGTMNTADRSIALLDTALRRRFTFRELMPDPGILPEIVAGVPLRKMLELLNERIEYLFDREHQIGHAYFIGCETRKDVDDRMRHRVIPLLAEYFYEDWGKVAAVLGDTEGIRFLERKELKAPIGLDLDGDASPRIRWSVRTPFSDDAYSTFK